MQMKLNIRERSRWRSVGDAMACGHANYNGALLNAKALCSVFSGVKGPADLSELMKALNGFFSMICAKEQIIYAAVDRVRSMPLFYSVDADGLILISDDAFWIQQELGTTHRNVTAEEEFILLGYTTGSDTLCREIKQIQAGDIVCFTEGPEGSQVRTIAYSRYIHHHNQALDPEALQNKFKDVLANMTQRMIEFAAGRQIVVPLSGGLDSRLLVLLLKQFKYENVAAFSYGNIHSEESAISKAVAEGLGLQWFFVPYSIASWKTWFHSPDFVAYRHLAFQLASCAHIQDFPAIWELKRKRAISPDAVIVPGICADLQAGSMSKDHRRDLYRSGPIDIEHLIESIVDQHYTLFDWSKRRSELYPQFRNRIASFLGDISTYPDAASAFEAQFCAEKVAKYLVNSVRAYEYWGYDWWLPYWDAEFIEFWKMMPIYHRIDKTFYNQYIRTLEQEMVPSWRGKALGRDRDAWWWTLRRRVRRTHFHNMDRIMARILKRWIIGQEDEFNWFGVMNEQQFRKWYTGQESIQSALVLEYIGKLTIHP